MPAMLSPSLTHYAPWNEHDGERARCGARVTDDLKHSLTPTCPVCAASLAAEEPAALAAELFAVATTRNCVYAHAVQRQAVVAKQRARLERYHVEYERWLEHAGPKPCREVFEDDMDDLAAELADCDRRRPA